MIRDDDSGCARSAACLLVEKTKPGPPDQTEMRDYRHRSRRAACLDVRVVCGLLRI